MVDVHLPDAVPAVLGPDTPASSTAKPPSRPPERPRIDGRLARSQRTIEHIVQALLELLERDRELRPTAHEVARRAGVSRRAVYLHFDSLEALFATAAERRASEVCATWKPPPHGTPLDERIEWFADQWSKLCETLLPIHQAATVQEPESPQLAATLDRARRWSRSAVELVFLPELSATPEDQRDALATALHHVSSWYAWDDLRRHGTDIEQARAALQRILQALLTRDR
jgi:TetR/AcrR family transcriptional regulator, regulator of autoinduction and epiphytic fitness